MGLAWRRNSWAARICRIFRVTIPDIRVLSRFKRTDQYMHQISAEFELVLARAEGRLTAKPSAASVSAQLIGAAILTDANRKPVLTAVRTELGNVDSAIHPLRRIS